MAVLQKYIDQGISVNTSYNPIHYEDEKIPMSVMLQHLIMFYKFGGKQLYYFNTYDGQGEIDVDKFNVEDKQVDLLDDIDDANCDSCVI
jgi:ribonucleoside-diphosphate reductase alpha chain